MSHKHIYKHDSWSNCSLCDLPLSDAVEIAARNRAEVENRRRVEGALRERLAKREAEKAAKSLARD